MPDTDPDPMDPRAPGGYDYLAWSVSEPGDAVIPAFVKALWVMEDVVKERSVSAGPMKYSYADLSAVLDEARPKLREHGIAISQVASTTTGVTTTLFHESGQWITFAPLRIAPAGATPQHVGSAITYARRYSLLAILGLATEDDDGHAAAVAAGGPAEQEANPLTGRVDAVMGKMKALADGTKAEMRKWADGEGRKLSGAALFGDAEWLSQVEAWLDVNEDDAELEPEEPF